MGRRQRHPGLGSGDRRLAEALPREASEAGPEGVQASGSARHGTGGDTDCVRHGLVAKGNPELGLRCGRTMQVEPGDRHEEVEQLGPPRGRIPPDRVPTARDARHDGLGDARDQRGGDRCICRGTTFRKDLEAHLGRRGVAGSDPGGVVPAAHRDRTVVEGHCPTNALLAFRR